MENKTEQIVSLFTSYKEKTFSCIKHCNYNTAVHQFLTHHQLDIEKKDIVEGEKVSYIDRYGVFKYKNTVKIKSLNLKFQISCFHQKEWEFQFDELLPSHLPIADEHIIKTTEKTVLVSYIDEEKQKKLYAIPVTLAETLDLEEFHEKQLEDDVKKEIFIALEPYQVTHMIQLKS